MRLVRFAQLASVIVLASAACSSSDEAGAPIVVPSAGGATGAGGSHGVGGSGDTGQGGAPGTSGKGGSAGNGGGAGGGSGGSSGSSGGGGGSGTAGSGTAGKGTAGAGTAGSGTAGTTGKGGSGTAGTGAAGSGTAGTGPSNGCNPITYPTGLVLETKPDAALTAEYKALGVGSCTLPACFLDVLDLKSPDGTTHDVHVMVGKHFALYELVGTEVDPNGTGNVDATNAYSTKVLVSADLVAHLDTLRDDYGGPVTITSGFRSPPHQHAICQSICGADQCTDASGAVTCAKNSRHMWGAAADMSLMYEAAANQANFPFVFHENGGTAPHLHVDMQACQ